MLMPSTADVHHVPVHPQPSLPATADVDMLPSPVCAKVGGCAVSVSSSSVLLDLSSATVGLLVSFCHTPYSRGSTACGCVSLLSIPPLLVRLPNNRCQTPPCRHSAFCTAM